MTRRTRLASLLSTTLMATTLWAATPTPAPTPPPTTPERPELLWLYDGDPMQWRWLTYFDTQAACVQALSTAPAKAYDEIDKACLPVGVNPGQAHPKSEFLLAPPVVKDEGFVR